MPIEHKVRSVGNKTIIYPWFRRHIVIGPYNRHVRRDIAASVLHRAFVVGASRLQTTTSRVSAGVSAARDRSTQSRNRAR